MPRSFDRAACATKLIPATPLIFLRRRVASALGALAVVVFFRPLCVDAAESIALSSTAAPDYVRPLDAKGQPKPETYIFFQGNFMGGATRDAAQAKTTFTDVTRLLAENLTKQRYYPTKDIPSADLLIMVHWGTTMTYEDPEKDSAIDARNTALADYTAAVKAGEMADAGPLNQSLAEQENTENTAQGFINRNAALLGYKRSLDRERKKIMSSPEELTMNLELNEDRYFVVLMAYDYQYMKKEHKRHLLWVTRLSIRSIGNNFPDALSALTVAGGDVFGHQLAGLERVKVPANTGHVTLHEMKILGEVDGPPSAAAKAAK